MFCKNCGAQSDGNQAFCKNCGNPFAQAQQESTQPQDGFAQEQPAYTQPQGGFAQEQQVYTQPQGNQVQQPAKKSFNPSAIIGKLLSGNKNQKIGKLAVAAVALIVVLSIFISLFSGGDGKKVEKIAEKYITYYYTEDYDVEKFFDLYYYDAFEAAGYECLENYEDVDEDDLKDEFNDMYEELIEVYEGYMEDKVDYIADTIDVDEEKLSKYLTLDFDDFEEYDEKDDEYEYWEDFFDDYDIEIKGAGYIEVDVEFEGDDDDYDFSLELEVVKIGSSWYIADGKYASIYYYYY